MRSVSGIGVLDKAIYVLDAVDAEPLALAGLVKATGLSRATAHRLAVALELHGFLERDGEGRFATGPRFRRPDLVALATPALEQLREATGESVQLYVRRGDKRLCVAALESLHGLRTIVEVGVSLPLDVGSAGKILREPPEISSAGWAQSVEERERGVASVSAPIRDGAGTIVAAVSVSGPVERTTRSPGRRYGQSVLAAAKVAAKELLASHHSGHGGAKLRPAVVGDPAGLAE